MIHLQLQAVRRSDFTFSLSTGMMDFRAILNISSTILAISAAAILGVLTRVFLNSLFGPTGADVTSMDRALFYDIPANVLGCFLLGAFMKVKEKYQIAPMVSVAISTGYTGSVTSMSSCQSFYSS